MDDHKSKFRWGKGGRKCPCCNPFGVRKWKHLVSRLCRRRLKDDTRKQVKEEGGHVDG